MRTQVSSGVGGWTEGQGTCPSRSVSSSGATLAGGLAELTPTPMIGTGLSSTISGQLHGTAWTPGPVRPPLEETGRTVKKLKGTDTPNGTHKLPSTKCS